MYYVPFQISIQAITNRIICKILTNLIKTVRLRHTSNKNKSICMQIYYFHCNVYSVQVFFCYVHLRQRIAIENAFESFCFSRTNLGMLTTHFRFWFAHILMSCLHDDITFLLWSLLRSIIIYNRLYSRENSVIYQDVFLKMKERGNRWFSFVENYIRKIT